jgi:hypothetical protein
MKFNIRSLAAFSMICFLTLFVGCGSGGGGDSSTGGSGGTGTLALSLTDAPSADLAAIYVTIERVEVHLGGYENNPNNWQEIPPLESGVSPFVKKTYNLLELTNGVLEQLGLTELRAGFYTQMRLFIGTEPDEGVNRFGDPHKYANYVIESGTTEQIPMKVPSGTQTGIKLVKGFSVEKDRLTELILDFDAAKSVHKAGNSGKYILQPTIKVLDAIALHFIEGAVFDDNDNPLQGVLVTAQKYNSSATDKDKVVVEATSITDANGEFLLLLRQLGPYNVVAYKNTYSFDYKCGVDAVIDTMSGVTTELRLLDLETEPPGYGYVGGNVAVKDGGDVTISFRAPAEGQNCEGKIEVKSETIYDVDALGSPYEEILPVSEEPYYEVVAWSGVTTDVRSGVTVQSEKTTVLEDFNF